MEPIEVAPTDNVRLDDENRDELERLLESKQVVKFDWENRWLKGEEYFYILANMEQYVKQMGIEKFGIKRHPESIYVEPINGLLYFVKGNSIGSEFGFPRLGIKKRYKWKKMNFTTDLPKRDPVVSYIVASAVKWEKFFPGSSKDGPWYRMHAVILKKRKNAVYPGWQINQKWYSYILCHVRKVKFKKGGNGEEWISDDGEEVNQNLLLNDNEEAKISKTGNKRGRPRKNQSNVKDDSSQQKSKRGRKPKKLYDIDPNGTKIGINVTFNESDNGDDESDDYELKHDDSPLGPIVQNFNNHKFSFDSMGAGMKNDFGNTPQYPAFPRKQSINNLEKIFNHTPAGFDYLNDDRRRFSSTLSPYNIPSNPPQFGSPNLFRGGNNAEFKPVKPVIFNKPANQPPQQPNQQNTEESNLQKKLNEIISQSFSNWNKPKRKETEEIDFSIQENPILNILQKSNEKYIY